MKLFTNGEDDFAVLNAAHKADAAYETHKRTPNDKMVPCDICDQRHQDGMDRKKMIDEHHNDHQPVVAYVAPVAARVVTPPIRVPTPPRPV